MDSGKFLEIESKIGYAFKNKELLLRAFTHSSYSNEHKREESYERLEFLGDAVIGFAVGLYLYEMFPNYAEGKLSKIRSGVVDRTTIASVVDELDIVKYVRAGAGNAINNVFNSVKAKCDLFEAIAGAMVIDNDGDIKAASEFALKFLRDKVDCAHDDYKSKLLEYCSKQGLNCEFREHKQIGDKNVVMFIAEIVIDGKTVSTGIGTSKKSAQQDASQKYFSK